MRAAPASFRTALVAGASGLVGREILAGLLADRSLAKVHTLGRRELPATHPKLEQHVVDFATLPALPPVDEVYLALGTTIKVAGSQQAFRAVDHDANLAVARAARKAGATRLALVSAMGADARSSIFYNRVKGELEAALAGLGYEALVIARPSMLAGDRQSLGQPVRSGEVLALRVSTALRPLIPANFRSIRAADVAAALLQALPRARGTTVLPSGAMQGASARA
ncbi:NAD(P)H-binding protein [Ramlibacter tataouinensis]|uniref:NAD(P)H-binding protein n=1 Tax=Ramlibacter tataouinensis TaxID=94132 RepID=UPI0022F3D617|nr:NAD(P)H-binding protein [Ramlibacter tataouinensis]WBY02620.1 NAD(P)H-binding protein [Ramlibacter tataouinensis]